MQEHIHLTLCADREFIGTVGQLYLFAAQEVALIEIAVVPRFVFMEQITKLQQEMAQSWHLDKSRPYPAYMLSNNLSLIHI